MTFPSVKTTWNQIIKMILYIRQAPDFIRDNKLWNGYFSHKWITTITIIIAIILSYTFYKEVFNLFSNQMPEQTVAQSALSLVVGLGEITNNMFFSGGLKYLIIIVLEVFIFHITVKTYEILSGEQQEVTINHFIDAQIRMIKVSIRAFIYESIASVIVAVILGILSLSILKTGAIFLIHAYFLGVAFIDNYNEQFRIKIKKSFSIAYHHIGASFVIGLVAYCLIFIPLAGVILTPLICAVATTSYMYYSYRHNEIPHTESKVVV